MVHDEALLTYYASHRAAVDTAADSRSLFLLDYLEHYGPMTSFSLASDTGFDEDATGNVIVPLLERGLVEKDDKGRLQVSEPGRQLLEELLGRAQEEAVDDYRERYSFASGIFSRMGIIWAVSAVLGGVIISFTTSASSVSQTGSLVLVRLLIPALVMVVYALYGYWYAAQPENIPQVRRQAHVNQLADSLYFLGFLWTLWALIDSFVIHQLSAGEAVFRAFGYALVTTAVGMFLRLLLLQSQHSANDQQDEATEDSAAGISAGYVSVGAGLNALNIDIHNTIREITRSLNESAMSVHQSLDAFRAQNLTLRNTLADIHKVNAEYAGKMIETVITEFTRELQPSLEALNQSQRSFASHINETEKQLLYSVTRFGETVDEVLSHATKATGDTTKSMAANLQSNAVQLQSSLAEYSNVLRASLDQSTQSVASTISTLTDRVAVEVAHIGVNLATVAKQIQQIRVPSDIVSVLEQHEARINENLVASTDNLKSAIDKLNLSIATLTEEMRSRSTKRRWRLFG